jgi:WD40 repeat protein
VSFRPSGKTLATGSIYASQNVSNYGQVRLGKIDSLKELNDLRAETDWDSGGVAPDDKSWKAPPGFATAFGWVQALAFSPDGTILIAASGKPDQPGGIKPWNLPAGKERAGLVGHTKPVTCLAFTHDHSSTPRNISTPELIMAAARQATARPRRP